MPLGIYFLSILCTLLKLNNLNRKEFVAKEVLKTCNSYSLLFNQKEMAMRQVAFN
jgi:hypothetical protein